MDELWSSIPDYVGLYQISNLDRIRSLSRIKTRKNGMRFTVKGKLLSPTQRTDGYFHICLHNEQKPKLCTVHRLVLLAFIGPCPQGMQCRHLNGVRGDNRLENLCWGTPEEDHQDKVRHGTHCHGESNPSAVLTDELVKEIRNLYSTGLYPMSQLARKYGIALGTIHPLIHRKTWRHL